MSKRIPPFLTIMLVLAALVPAVSAAPLTVHPTNPRYFTDGSGKAIYMTGSHTWFLIQTDPPMQQTDNSYQHMEDYLDWVQSFGHNYLRIWANFHYSDTPPHPWQRTGPGTVCNGGCDGGLKADMTKFNQSYFDMLRQRVLQVTSRGMYVSVLIFGSGVGIKDSSIWAEDFWNPNNNVNPELAAAFSTTNGNSFYTSNAAAMNIQKLLAAKMIDTLNDQDNIIWEVINEGQLPEGEAWQNSMMNYIRSYEAAKLKQHLILMSGCGCNPGNVLFNSNADCISPDGVGSYSFSEGADPDYTDKIIIADTDHVGGFSDPAEADIYRKWVWRAFTRGAHTIFMDSYDSYVEINGEVWNDGSINHVFDGVRTNMGYTKNYADRMDLNTVFPHDELSSTAFCLANPGQEYLAYQPSSGSFTVNLQAGTYNYEWFNPSSGTVAGTGTVTASGGSKTFTPPFSGDAVLYLKVGSAQPYCGDGSCNGAENCSSCPGDCGACPSQDPVAWWKLDEASGTTTSDSSGNGNTGTISGAAWVTGKLGNTLSFDGADDYVNVGSGSSIDDINVKTVSAWIKFNSYGEGSFGRIIDKEYSDDEGWFFYLNNVDVSNSFGYFHQVAGVGTTYGDWAASANSLSTGQWYHLAVVYDRTNVNNDPIFYVNGVLKSTTELTAPSATPAGDGNQNAYIGNKLDGTRTFDGLIDDVRIYDRALSASEIQAIHKSAFHKSDSDCNGCVSDTELFAFIDRWKVSNVDVTLKELIEAIGLWKRGC